MFIVVIELMMNCVAHYYEIIYSLFSVTSAEKEPSLFFINTQISGFPNA